MPEKICPACGVPMRVVESSTKYDIPLRIEQCDSCGGLWFDDPEMYLVKMGEAAQIDGVDREKLREPVVTKKLALYCPNDHELLKIFKDPFFPKSLEIETCPRCHGFWLNRGEFASYQEHRQAHIDRYQAPIEKPKTSIASDPEFEAQLDRLMALSSANNLQGVANFAKFLSQPIDPITRRPLSGGPNDDNQKQKVAAAAALALAMIRLIIRLFAKT
jgi:Zn-finger nucleic acid-binding protein